MAITPHKDMMKNRDDAFSVNECYDNCTSDRQKFYISGAWWEGAHKKQFKNRPKPEFNKLWRPINRLIGDINDMELNSVIISNSDDATDEGAELMQKRWRNDFQSSEGIEASENANSEAIVGGFGCLKVVSKYEDEEDPDPEKQYLTLEIVNDASNSVRFDSGSVKKDKSDSRWGWHLVAGNSEAFKEQFGVDRIVSFPNERPGFYDLNNSTEQRDSYIAHYYELVDKTLTEHDFSLIAPLKITSGDGIKDEEGKKYTRDELSELKQLYLEETGESVPTRRRKTKYVMYAVADGEKYLTKPQKMPFKRIPLIPRYAYYTVINGQEFFCGEVRKQIDHELFHNYFGSALMKIMSKPQVSKPEYLPEQIARHANQRARDDIDDLPYVASDPVKDKNGDIRHMGPVGFTQPPQIGSGLATAGSFLEQNLTQMASSGQSTVPANSSGKAIQMANQRADDTFLPIVKSILHSIKGACECWIPAAQKLYFSMPRKLRVMEIDGNYGQVTTMEMTQLQTGEYGPYGNTTPGKYAVRVEQGEAYKDQRSAERETNLEMLQYVGTDTEFGQLIALNAMTLTNGEGGGMMRKVARYRMLDQIIAMQIPFKPENEEEAQYVQMKMQQIQAQQQQAMMQQQQAIQQTAIAEGQARLMEGQAALQNEQNDAVKNAIAMEKVNNDKIKLAIDAQKVGADIEKIQSETAKNQLESAEKLSGMIQ